MWYIFYRKQQRNESIEQQSSCSAHEDTRPVLMLNRIRGEYLDTCELVMKCMQREEGMEKSDTTSEYMFHKYMTWCMYTESHEVPT